MTLMQAVEILNRSHHRMRRWKAHPGKDAYVSGDAPQWPMVTLDAFEAVAIAEHYARIADEKAAAEPRRRNTHEQWANGGGPNECRHGIAAGLTCNECPRFAG